MQGQTKEQLLDALSGKSEAIFEKGLKDLKANKDVVCFDECKLDYDRITKLVDVIPSNSSVKEISFNNCDMSKGETAYLLANIASFDKLESLSFKGNDVGLEASEALGVYVCKTQSLKKLDVSSNKMPPPAVINIFHGVSESNLEEINMDDNPASDENVSDFVRLISKRHSSLKKASFKHFFLEQKGLDKLNSVMKIKQSYLNTKQNIDDVKRINISRIATRGRG